MWQLCDKAAEFVGRNGDWTSSDFFYRDKTENYYDFVRRQRRGFLSMDLKNENGDPASPVNGCIEGVFLGVNALKTGDRPIESPFGDLRCYFPVDCVYRCDFNMYFADFYCHDGSKSHHISLIITRANSTADNFCRSRLPKLNRLNNPFLYQERVTGRLMHKTAAWIDIFYTEIIHINSGWFEWVEWIYNTSKKTGKPKNASCQICNIYGSSS